MYAQRKAPYAPSTSPGGRYGYRPVPVRARVGLAMRRAMNFGPMGDAEPVLRAAGLSVAPMAIDEPTCTASGVTVMAVSKVEDLDTGLLKALIVPAGAADDEGQALLDQAIVRAHAKGAPVLAFGDGVAATLRVLTLKTDGFDDAPAILVLGKKVERVEDLAQLSLAAARIG